MGGRSHLRRRKAAPCRRGPAAFTLIEVLIVVVLMAILASVVITQLSDSTHDARLTTARYNLQSLRKQIELYQQQHDGKLPSSDLKELLATTDSAGNIGSGAAYTFGPYLMAIPENPMTGSRVVRAANSDPPATASGASDAGWLYHAATGNIWVDHDELLRD
jgi:general secretion pathway protein G